MLRTVLPVFVLVLSTQSGCAPGVTNEQNTQETRTNSADPGWAETEYTVWLGGETPHGILQLTAGRYIYQGTTGPEGAGPDMNSPFYFVQHPAGELSFEESLNARTTLGHLHFDPLGADYDSSNPRRTLGVRRTDSGGFEMHSIVSEFQQWRIETQ